MEHFFLLAGRSITRGGFSSVKPVSCELKMIIIILTLFLFTHCWPRLLEQTMYSASSVYGF